MRFTSDTRILVVGAHPDDEVLGCGATIAKAIRHGAKVSAIFLGEGISARFPVGEHDCPEFYEQTKVRTEGAKKALAALGVEDVVWGDMLCGQFDQYALLGITKKIEAKIRDFRPTMVWGHDITDVNQDHKIAFRAMECACRPAQSHAPKQVYSFEIVCSGKWSFDTQFQPNVFVDVSEDWDKKMEAWHCYTNEDRPFPFPRSDEGLLNLAQSRGIQSGLKKAEAFRLLREIN